MVIRRRCSEASSLCAHFRSLLSMVGTDIFRLQLVHGRLIILGLSTSGRSLTVTTKLLSLAASLSPTPEYARRLFDDSSRRDTFFWNSLLRAYSDLGPVSEIPFLYLRMHREGFPPDHYTFTFVIRACAVLDVPTLGRQAHNSAVKHGLHLHHFFQTALISLYFKCASIREAEMVFDEMGVMNVVSWTSLIAGYAQNCLFTEAAGVFQRMVRSLVRPNEVALVSVLPCFQGECWLHSGKMVHGFVIKMGLRLFISLTNALISMYGKCGSVATAKLLFEEMEVRSPVSWNTLIGVYEQAGEAALAIEQFRRMLVEKVQFDCVTLVSVLTASASLGALEAGRWVHALAKESGLESDARIGNVLVDMYSKCGSTDLARDIFDNLNSRSVVTWSAMISAYANHGCPDEALKLFDLMLIEGVKPNSFTFTSVLVACAHQGLVDDGLKHFNSMKMDYKVVPTLENCACIVDMLGRAGRLTEAYEFIRKMRVKPDKGVWGALLGGCRIHGNLELAEFVARNLLNSPHNDVTFYLLMANLYADACRWDDAVRMRKSMKEMELNKAPGYSSLRPWHHDEQLSEYCGIR